MWSIPAPEVCAGSRCSPGLVASQRPRSGARVMPSDHVVAIELRALVLLYVPSYPAGLRRTRTAVTL
ncbi:hypothetical protein J6590_032783, partial [Homalodisca vitripennis]